MLCQRHSHDDKRQTLTHPGPESLMLRLAEETAARQEWFLVGNGANDDSLGRLW